MTASPGRLLVLLMQAALRNLAGAAKYLDDDDKSEADPMLRKASDIIWELQKTLDPGQNPELATTLGEVYENVASRLVVAMANGDAALVREASELFSPIAAAFEDVVFSEEKAA